MFLFLKSSNNSLDHCKISWSAIFFMKSIFLLLISQLLSIYVQLYLFIVKLCTVTVFACHVYLSLTMLLLLLLFSPLPHGHSILWKLAQQVISLFGFLHMSVSTFGIMRIGRRRRRIMME